MSSPLPAKYEMFANRLRKVSQHRRRKARHENVTCYRLYDLDLPEFPFAIDLYEAHVHVAEYRRNHTLGDAEYAEWLALSRACIAEVLQVPPENIHIKQRAVITDRREQYGHFAQRSETLVVSEHGARFRVNLSDYLDTGLFLDHRPTRQLVRTQARGLRVLNLFAYTGSFSVYAALGGAAQVTTVDLSNTYIEWAKDNFRLNGLAVDAAAFIAADVMTWLPAQRARSFDLIVCDPPTFSNSKKMQGVFDVQRDHPALINQCLRLLAAGGKLYFSTNNRKFKLYDEHLAACDIKDITRQTTGFDFEGKLNRLCYLLQPTLTDAPSPWPR
ncbi:MAG TPA: class I SAM-dependent methyltransferase [Candidatus Acidoferrum sp.]|nr:class I SAM-dependent methyltransferase [Candidatus Acidoferrum sp.]